MYANKEDRKKWWKKYKEEHREEIKQRNHLYWKSKDGKENKKRYYKNHQEEIIQKVTNYRNQNQDKVKTYNKKYYNEIRNKAILVWEETNGIVPDGCLIIHKDKNKNNNNLDNLEMITRKELGTMNLNNLAISENKEITEVNILLAKIKNKTRDIRRTK